MFYSSGINLKEKDYSGDLGIDGRIILEWNLQKPPDSVKRRRISLAE